MKKSIYNATYELKSQKSLLQKLVYPPILYYCQHNLYSKFFGYTLMILSKINNLLTENKKKIIATVYVKRKQKKTVFRGLIITEKYLPTYSFNSFCLLVSFLFTIYITRIKEETQNKNLRKRYCRYFISFRF